MSKVKIINGTTLPNMPWQDRPEGHYLPIWRYTENPIIDRNPLPGIARIFNSSVVPYEGAFVGVFRAEATDGRPFLYLGHSDDGIHWEYENNVIPMVNEKGESAIPFYQYDPRLIKIEDDYYIVWCQDFYGAALAVAEAHHRGFFHAEGLQQGKGVVGDLGNSQFFAAEGGLALPTAVHRHNGEVAAEGLELLGEATRPAFAVPVEQQQRPRGRAVYLEVDFRGIQLYVA